jgi:hypothetical protein
MAKMIYKRFCLFGVMILFLHVALDALLY